MNYERRALYWGVGINVFSSILGLVFFFITHSQTLFLDAFISLILCVSTIISIVVNNVTSKKDTEKYPLGRYAIESVFLVFRALLMLIIIAYTIIEGSMTIYDFIVHNEAKDLNINYVYMLIYCALMVGSCLAITFAYSYYNKKLEVPSEMIKIEIVSSIYDGLVTLFATASLLIFRYLTVLEPVAPIGDSIVVIVLSLFYLIIPIKEIAKQIRILTDKRQNQDIEKEIRLVVKQEFGEYHIYDVYCAYLGDVASIYICLYPRNDIVASQIRKDFLKIRDRLSKEYNNSKIILILSQKKLHAM